MSEAIVQAGRLQDGKRSIIVESPAWFAWLEQAERFRYEGLGGHFGARRERFQRGGWYWKAYRRVAGQLRRAYLGKASDLTLARLEQAAITLAGQPAPLPTSEPTEPDALLWTKLSPPPQRNGLIGREPLITHLDRALDHRLTLLVAPAGWGKSTLLASWITTAAVRWQTGLTARDAKQPHLAWLALDQADNDPARMWSYFCAAIGQHEPAIRAAEAAFRSPRPLSPETVMTSLINVIANQPGPTQTPIVLVLDDFHVLSNHEILEATTFLIEHMPARLHLIVASRSEPPLPLARWRAAGQITELRAADLRFDLEQANTLLTNVIGRSLSPAAVQRIATRTEGWVAGLHLAGLALRTSTNSESNELIDQISGSHPYFLDYLMSEVLRHQPVVIQTFLLETAILDRMCAEVCDALLDPGSEHHAATTLADVERLGLFLFPLDQERRWFRYHQLFSDALRATLQRNQPKRVAELHRRAMAWYQTQARSPDDEYAIAAIEHALAAGEYMQAAALIEQIADTLIWRRGELHTLQRWIQAFPPAEHHNYPHMLLREAWIQLAMIKIEQLGRHLVKLDELVAHGASDSIVGEVLVLHSYRERIQGNLIQAIRLGEHARELIDPSDGITHYLNIINLQNAHLELGNLPAARGLMEQLQLDPNIKQSTPVLTTIAGKHLIQADLLVRAALPRQAEALLHQTLSSALQHETRHLAPAGMVYVGLAEACYEQGKLDDAERYARLAMTHGGRWWNSDVLHNSHHILGRILNLRGAEAEAEAAFAHARQLVDAYQITFINDLIRIGAAWGAFRGNDLDTAELILAEYQIKPTTMIEARWFEAYMLLASIELRRRRYSSALAIVRQLQTLAHTSDYTARVLAMHVLEALIEHSAGHIRNAQEALSRALTLAAQGGMIRYFIEQGEPMHEMLVALLNPDSPNQLAPEQQLIARHILVRFPNTATTIPARPISNHALIETEHLTERELEILQLVATGASNQAIAQQLVISLHTVKKHLTHILAKLNAPSRTAAVAHARDRGML